MKKKLSLKLLVFVFIVLLSLAAAGCSRNEQQATGEAKKTTITIKDSTGKEITVPRGLSRIVLLNSDAAEALRILGVSGDIIAGVSDSVREDPYLGLEGKPSVGKSFTPNIEKIVQLKPQAVITYGKWPDTKLEEKLEPVGIRVIRLDFYKPETYDRDLAAAAKIFEKEKRAEAFLNWKTEKTAVVTERVKKLKEQEKVKVYGTWYSSFEKGEWKPYAQGTALHQGIELAGGVNIARELEGYPAVSAEWVLQKNPDAAVFGVLEEKGLGYTATGSTVVAGLRNNALQNQILSKTGAGRKESVYFLNTKLLGGDKTYLGALYLAKWFYPDLFQDIDPDQVLEEYFENWLRVPFKGIWAYPEQ
ncbi:MAG: iron complex transport system substrate-binding protein [Clostridia bacterium]|jgi:iron complex transport system substrate-binding protein|nr:iron complex transport system substrate-binding protein [Clostridia bacterium]